MPSGRPRGASKMTGRRALDEVLESTHLPHVRRRHLAERSHCLAP
jgi:hypothetical protein